MLSDAKALAHLKTMFKEQIKQGAYPIEPQKLKEVITTITGACKKIPRNELDELMKDLIKECSDEALAEPLSPPNANFIGAMTKIATASIHAGMVVESATKRKKESHHAVKG